MALWRAEVAPICLRPATSLSLAACIRFSAFFSACCSASATAPPMTAGGRGTLWGQLVNESRNLVLKRGHWAKLEASEIQYLGRLVVNFAHLLRSTSARAFDRSSLHIFAGGSDEPSTCLESRTSHSERGKWRADAKIDGFEEMQLDHHARAPSWTSPARANASARRPYRFLTSLIRQMIFLYLITLPWGLIGDRGWTIPAETSPCISWSAWSSSPKTWANPSAGPDDLRLEDICKSIEDSMKELGTPSHLGSRHRSGNPALIIRSPAASAGRSAAIRRTSGFAHRLELTSSTIFTQPLGCAARRTEHVLACASSIGAGPL